MHCLLVLMLFCLVLFALTTAFLLLTRVPKLNRRIDELAAEIRQVRADLDSRVPLQAGGTPSRRAPEAEP
jgi:hypothetical protein